MLQTNNIPRTPVASEEGRRPTEQATGVTPPDPEVLPMKKRRNLTVAYKIKIVETITALRKENHGGVGAFLRKEGLYHSMVKKWEQQVNEGTLIATSRGPKQKSRLALLEENKQLRRQLERIEQRLERTEMIVELQKKLSSILDIASNPLHERPDGR
jgi:transposase